MYSDYEVLFSSPNRGLLLSDLMAGIFYRLESRPAGGHTKLKFT